MEGIGKFFSCSRCNIVMDLPPALRANVDYVFLLRENITSEQRKTYISLSLVFSHHFDMFNKVMDACTENYECLVLDNTVKSNRIQDCVFWYKASVRKNFRVGSPDLWKLHKKMFNPKYLQQKEDDAKKATKKTNSQDYEDEVTLHSFPQFYGKPDTLETV
jgi:hypothetical protein